MADMPMKMWPGLQEMAERLARPHRPALTVNKLQEFREVSGISGPIEWFIWSDGEVVERPDIMAAIRDIARGS